MAKAKKKNTKKKTETDGEGEGGKPNKIVGLIGSVIGPVILGASTFGVVYLIPSNAVHGPEVVETEAHDEKPDYTVKAPVDLEYVALDEITISARGGNRVLRIALTLEVPSGGSERIDPGDPRLRDAFMGYLRAIEASQLDEASFLAQLRAQLLRRAQLVVGQQNVHGVLVTDFLVR